eukprot:SAG22_NODE_593_length_8808_cov_21.674590_8_plen_112_part_00
MLAYLPACLPACVCVFRDAKPLRVSPSLPATTANFIQKTMIWILQESNFLGWSVGGLHFTRASSIDTVGCPMSPSRGWGKTVELSWWKISAWLWWRVWIVAGLATTHALLY